MAIAGSAIPTVALKLDGKGKLIVGPSRMRHKSIVITVEDAILDLETNPNMVVYIQNYGSNLQDMKEAFA